VPDNAKIVFFASTAATGVTIWANFKKGGLAGIALARDGLLMAPFFSAMVFWFFSAPDVRFLGRLLELMFALSMWSMVCSLDRLWGSILTDWVQRFSIARQVSQYFNFTVFLLCLMLIFCVRLWPVQRLTWPTLPEAVTLVVKSEWGVGVQVPADGSCWFNALPCSPSADPKLQYRQPLSDDPKAHGFRLRDSP